MGTRGLCCAAIAMTLGSACTSGSSNADGEGVTLFVTTHGAGRVIASPSALACDGDVCTLTGAPGTTIALTADPEVGSTFAGWEGACTGAAASCTVELASTDVAVSASFVPAATSLAVLLAGSGSGTVTGLGIDCTEGNAVGCSAALAPGIVDDLTATPAPGSVFTGWSEGCGSYTTCVMTIGAQLETVEARFEPIGLGVAETGQGTITSTPGTIDCVDNTGTCAESYASGGAVTLTATPADGWAFAN